FANPPGRTNGANVSVKSKNAFTEPPPLTDPITRAERERSADRRDVDKRVRVVSGATRNQPGRAVSRGGLSYVVVRRFSSARGNTKAGGAGYGDRTRVRGLGS